MTEYSHLAEWITVMRGFDRDQMLAHHSWVLVEQKCICVTIPKNACSRTKLTLHLLAGNEDPGDLGNVHDMGQHLASFADETIIQMLTSPEWFRFCFVRNPYDRLLSAYKTQVGNIWNKQYQWLKDDIKNGLGYAPDDDPERLVPFRDFVRYLRSANERVRHDGHFNAQARVLIPHLIAYDYIGRVETYQKDFAEVLRRLNAPPEIVATAAQPKNETSKVYPPAIAYDDELANLVLELYEADFEAFGYDRDYWMHA